MKNLALAPASLNWNLTSSPLDERLVIKGRWGNCFVGGYQTAYGEYVAYLRCPADYGWTKQMPGAKTAQEAVEKMVQREMTRRMAASYGNLGENVWQVEGEGCRHAH